MLCRRRYNEKINHSALDVLWEIPFSFRIPSQLRTCIYNIRITHKNILINLVIYIFSPPFCLPLSSSDCHHECTYIQNPSKYWILTRHPVFASTMCLQNKLRNRNIVLINPSLVTTTPLSTILLFFLYGVCTYIQYPRIKRIRSVLCAISASQSSISLLLAIFFFTEGSVETNNNKEIKNAKPSFCH